MEVKPHFTADPIYVIPGQRRQEKPNHDELSHLVDRCVFFSTKRKIGPGMRKSLKRWLLPVLSALVLVLILWQTAVWTRQAGVTTLMESGHQELNRYVLHLQGQLEKFAFLPGVLATNQSLVELLKNPGDAGLIDSLNRYLETLNRITGTSDTYLMDSNGLTIAASNWLSERPFVGSNFSYRPYFQEAMKGRLGRYFALGTTSNKRGYYFAYPVRSEEEILGAVVVKINMAPIEKSWVRAGAELIVTDPDGVIFITTHKDWRFKTLTPLAPEVRERIRQSRRYGDVELATLPINFVETFPAGAQILELEGAESMNYLMLNQAMPQAGWKVHTLISLDQIHGQVLRVLLFAAVLLGVLFLLALLWIQRRQRLAEQARFERQAKRTLEVRVSEQTKDITAANVRLRQEIEEHRQTESELKQTQNELIQSAKLAVIGQMSTGITHELNQPLAAIRSYADNARALFKRGRGEEVDWNLAQISELTDRMAQISSQLKLFARKTSGKRTTVSIASVVDDSLRLLDSRIRKINVDVEVSLAEGLHYVTADLVQLDQVLVNIIGNALHAVEQLASPSIRIDAANSQNGQFVLISISDNGPGIPEEQLERVFDPFFTTKEQGRGLGLGLSISQRIIEALSGKLTAENRPEGGALFRIQLPTSSPPLEP